MAARTVIIKRFGVGSLAQWGFIAGIIVACLPACVCSWVLFSFMGALRGLIGGWQDVGITVLGQRISFNLIEQLNLQNIYETLTNISALGVFGIILLTLVLALGLGIFGAAVMAVLGLFYNATGRVKLELEEETNPQVPLTQQPTTYTE